MLLAALAFAILFPEIHGQPDCLRNFRFKYYQKLGTPQNLRQMSAWSGGGGRPYTLPSDSNNLFAGRSYGGGDRWAIYGTRAFGSGYPYGAQDPLTVAGRPFPYGTWPIPWGGNYAGSDEYTGKVADMQRPGGRLVNVELVSTDNKWGSTDDERYYLIGDIESVVSITASMVDWCHTVPVWPSVFAPMTNGSLRPENVLQYYRSSSFALAFKGYNNSFALPPLNTSTSLSHEQSSPLPDVVQYSRFLKCINETIANALPLLDGWDLPDPTRAAKSGGAIFGYTLLAIVCIVLFWKFCCR